MEQKNNVIDIRRFIRASKKIWWLFLASAIICVGAAGWYVSRSLQKFPITGEMLIGEESMIDGGASALAAAKAGGGMGQMLKTFSIGGLGGSAVDNELLVLGSHDVMLRTVRALDLNRSYLGKTEDGTKALLWRNSPVVVAASSEYFDTLATGFNLKIKLLPGGKADIVATKGLLRKVIAEAKDVKLPTLFSTPLGKVEVLRGESFDSSPYRTITVNVNGNNPAAVKLAKDLDIAIKTKLSDVIYVDLECANKDLGKAIVNGVMAEYNAKRLDRVHETAVNSIKYYDGRIAETLKQLEQSEKKMADYKRDKQFSGTESEAKVLTEMGAETKAIVLAAQNSINYYETVVKTLRNGLNSDALIPQMAAMGDTSLIAKYNKLILERRELRQSATEDNPVLVQLNQRISSMAGLIESNADMLMAQAKSKLDAQMGLSGLISNRLGQYPNIELDYVPIYRDTQFLNSLYIYLVQARENAVLKLYADTDLGYVFEPAYVSKPGLPIKNILLVVGAFLFALIGSSIIALIVMRFSQRVQQPMDLAFMGIDAHAFNYDDSNQNMARMRTMLMSEPDRRVIYLADFANNSSVKENLLKSFTEAGLEPSVISADTDSYLLSPEINADIDKLLATTQYVFVNTPNAENIFMLENAISSREASLLIIVPDSMKRKQLKKLLKGQQADKVYTLIVK
ncbi:MAG: hypothetical protein NC338_02935 [Firmicutes bacterium]|nr:hypothetical protein [Bacillota bacterium]MCM1401231.1 hypothetical protein [Bacteroides sp.]MCM1477220.1 hypothetical protein [Bacteroides sp.]